MARDSNAPGDAPVGAQMALLCYHSVVADGGRESLDQGWISRHGSFAPRIRADAARVRRPDSSRMLRRR
jgi:hypothetical protein